MKTKKTITIGIPAYNEEANIGNILSDLSRQNLGDFRLDTIIVASDGSTDKTVKVSRSSATKKVRVIDNKIRKGASLVQNQILNEAKSDILILLDADIRIKSKYFVKNIAQALVKENADLVSCPIHPARPETFTESVLFTSIQFKDSLLDKTSKKNNVYSCHGAIRAFSKKFYRSIKFPSVIGEDAYSYFYATTNNFKYVYTSNTQAFYRLPGNIEDHEKQSVRFYQSQKRMEKLFGEDLIKKEYRLPKLLIIKEMAKATLKNPIKFSFYVLIHQIMHFKSKVSKESSPLWNMVNSSKSITIL